MNEPPKKPDNAFGLIRLGLWLVFWGYVISIWIWRSGDEPLIYIGLREDPDATVDSTIEQSDAYQEMKARVDGQ